MLRRFILLMTICILSFTFFMSTIVISAQGTKELRVVGYCSEVFNDSVDTIQFDKLTHITYAFLIPKEDGSLFAIEKPDKLKELVKKSHQNNVKVLIAVGGWSYKNIPLSSTFEKIAASAEARKKLEDNISNFIDEYQLEGVEIDWEYPTLGQSSQNYEKLILELRQRMNAKGKYLTAAVAGSWSETEGTAVSEAITSNCLNAFDWINIMAYDLFVKHSPYWFAETSVDYWLNRGVPKDKIVLGVPFYAKPSWEQYRTLVADNKENAYKDYAYGVPLDSYYNGINTIKEKTRLAYNKASGIMIFDINEDAAGDLSLLKAINDTQKEVLAMSADEFKNKIYFIANNKELTFNDNDGLGSPFIDKNNRTLVPVRKCLEYIGASVSYDAAARTVTAKKDGTVVKITIDQNNIQVNDNTVTLDTKAIIKNNRTYVPFRAVFEAFNYQVDWHGGSNTIVVTK